MRFLAFLLMVAACGADPESGMPGRGVIKRGVFVQGGGYFAAASSPSGQVARQNRDAGICVLGADLKTAQTISLAYELEDQRSVPSMAYASDGAIAAATWELDHFGQVDERSQQHLVLVAPTGDVVWSRLVIENVPWTSTAQVAISDEQVFIVGFEGNLIAYSRATGDVAWQQSIAEYSALRHIAIAVGPDGEVAVATNEVSTSRLMVYGPDGSVRWSASAESLGVRTFDRVAYAHDGTVAVVGNDGGQTTAPQRVILVNPGGQASWWHSLGDGLKDFVTSLATDGTHIVAAGDATGAFSFDPSMHDAGDDREGFLASIGAGGIEGVEVFGGEQADVLALTGPDSAMIRVRNGLSSTVVANTELEIDDFTLPGTGMGLLEIEIPR